MIARLLEPIRRPFTLVEMSVIQQRLFRLNHQELGWLRADGPGTEEGSPSWAYYEAPVLVEVE